jgi:Mg-chelatase subunit ChlD
MTSELDVSKKNLLRSNNDEKSLSLSQKLTKGLEEIKAKKDFLKKIFLLDISGSMEMYVEGRSKLDHLRHIMKDYPEARKVCFSSDVYCNVDRNGNVDCTIPTSAHGSTDLARAIRHLRGLAKRPERIVLISDGEPDDMVAATREATGFSVPIDIIFIGQKGSSGERFMIDLARLTRGRQFTIEDKSANFQKQLSVKIAGLLTCGNEN